MPIAIVNISFYIQIISILYCCNEYLHPKMSKLYFLIAWLNISLTYNYFFVNTYLSSLLATNKQANIKPINAPNINPIISSYS